MKLTIKKSIKYHVLGVLIFIILVCLVSIYYAGLLNSNLHAEKVEYLTEVNSKGAAIISTKVSDSFAEIKGVAAFLSEGYSSNPEKMMEILAGVSYNNEFKRMGIITLDGNATMTDGYTDDFSDRDYFKKASSGESCVSDVLIDRIDNKEIIVFSVPMIVDEKNVAVLFATRSIEDFSKLLEVQSFGGEGFSYVIKQNGSPVIDTVHKNSIGKYTNLFSALRKDAKEKSQIDKMQKDVSEGKTGTARYTRSGVLRETSYMPVGVNDWYVISVVPTEAVFVDADYMIMLVLVAGGLVFVAVLYLCFLLAKLFAENTKRLQAVAYTDNVTGYSNWNKFALDCTALLNKNLDKKYAMLIFDIDHFKVINDIYGHQKGNELLKSIAEILHENTNSHYETFARSSADNFNVLMSYENDSDIIRRIKHLSENVSSLLEDYKIMLSFGIYMISSNLPNISTMSDRATIARLKIKGKTDVLYSFFDESARKTILSENEMENSMENALKNGEFEIYLQPKFSFETEKIVGAEALCRWNRPEKGLIPPDSFIPLFERNGFIRNLDSYMFEKVCFLLSRWGTDHNMEMTISVNLSRVNITTATLVQRLLATVNKYNINPSLVEIEITESAVFEDTQKLIAIMRELQDAGFSVSIDDFGSGYSSLNILKDLPTDTIKMDKGFLDEATDNEKAKLIISSLIQMSKSLGLLTVAEGVETTQQVEFLKNAGCDIAQGYYYAKPMPIEDFEVLYSKINGGNFS